MQQEMLKTSWKQRLAIGFIAVALLVSSIAVYVVIIMSNGGGSSLGAMEAKLESIAKEYEAKQTQIANLLSKDNLETLKSYKSTVKGFNAEAANQSGLQRKDIVEGDGTEITEDFYEYQAYYIGWCADETVFDSSFDNYDSPTSLKAPVEPAYSDLITGWTDGMRGIKVGGVRELTIPSELAYGESTSPCGTANSPIKFLVMTIKLSEEANNLYSELDEIRNRYTEAYYAYYMAQQSTVTTEEDEQSADDSSETETTEDNPTEASE